MFLARFALLCKIRTFPSDAGARLKTPDASTGLQLLATHREIGQAPASATITPDRPSSPL